MRILVARLAKSFPKGRSNQKGTVRLSQEDVPTLGPRRHKKQKKEPSRIRKHMYLLVRGLRSNLHVARFCSRFICKNAATFGVAVLVFLQLRKFATTKESAAVPSTIGLLWRHVLQQAVQAILFVKPWVRDTCLSSPAAHITILSRSLFGKNAHLCA